MDLPAYHIFTFADTPYGRTKSWHVPQRTIGSISKVIYQPSMLIQASDIRGYVLALRGDAGNNAKKTIVNKSDDVYPL